MYSLRPTASIWAFCRSGLRSVSYNRKKARSSHQSLARLDPQEDAQRLGVVPGHLGRARLDARVEQQVLIIAVERPYGIAVLQAWERERMPRGRRGGAIDEEGAHRDEVPQAVRIERALLPLGLWV